MSKTILVVDDEQGVLDVLKDGLELKNYAVLSALNTDKALEMLAKNKVDLLITDIAMPGKSGFKLVEEIRKSFKHRYLPVIVLTGIKTKEMVAKGVKLKVNDYLTKPVDFPKLHVSIRKCFGMEQPKEAAAAPIQTDLTKLRILVVDDEHDILALVKEYLSTVVEYVATAASVDQAINFLKSNSFDLIISDVSMPEKSGFELAEWINNSADHIGTPIIMMTGVIRDAESIRKAQQLLIDKYLLKPVDLLQLKGTIDEFCNFSYKRKKYVKCRQALDEQEEQKNEEQEEQLNKMLKTTKKIKANIDDMKKKILRISADDRPKDYHNAQEELKQYEMALASSQEEMGNTRKEFHDLQKNIIKLKRGIVKKLDNLKA